MCDWTIKILISAVKTSISVAIFNDQNNHIRIVTTQTEYYLWIKEAKLNFFNRKKKSSISLHLWAVLKKEMGFLFSKLWSLFSNEEHKIIIVGLDNAGKTTILYQFLMNEVVHTSPTIGSNVEEVVWKNIHFLMW